MNVINIAPVRIKVPDMDIPKSGHCLLPTHKRHVGELIVVANSTAPPGLLLLMLGIVDRH